MPHDIILETERLILREHVLSDAPFFFTLNSNYNVVKYTGDSSFKMIEEAEKHGVFISEDPQLLALLSRLNVDEEIPQELYTAVAVVLSWVYWLKGLKPGDERSEVQTS